MPVNSQYFHISRTQLISALSDLPIDGTLSIRSGGEIRIKGAESRGEFRDEAGKRFWKNIELKSFCTRLSDLALYIFTEKLVYRISEADKARASFLGKVEEFEDVPKTNLP